MVLVPVCDSGSNTPVIPTAASVLEGHAFAGELLTASPVCAADPSGLKSLRMTHGRGKWGTYSEIVPPEQSSSLHYASFARSDRDDRSVVT